MGHNSNCASERRRGGVTGGGKSVSNSGSIAGRSCGKLLLPCCSRDVHQLPAELFTAARVAGEVASPFPLAPGEVASLFPLEPGEVASLFPLEPGEVASLSRLARLNRSVRSPAPAPRSCSPSRFARQSARRGCSPARLGFPPRAARARSSTPPTSLHAGRIRARLVQPPRAAGMLAGAAPVTGAGVFLREPPPIATLQPFRASRSC
jgi:hypothetical protein